VYAAHTQPNPNYNDHTTYIPSFSQANPPLETVDARASDSPSAQNETARRGNVVVLGVKMDCSSMSFFSACVANAAHLWQVGVDCIACWGKSSKLF